MLGVTKLKENEEKIMRLLKTARGQIDGLLKMVEDNRYCIDISNQLMSTQSIMRNVNKEVLHKYLNKCALESFDNDSIDDKHKKVQEIIKVIDKLEK